MPAAQRPGNRRAPHEALKNSLPLASGVLTLRTTRGPTTLSSCSMSDRPLSGSADNAVNVLDGRTADARRQLFCASANIGAGLTETSAHNLDEAV